MILDAKQQKDLIKPVCDIAFHAGEEIVKIYQEGFEIVEKKDHSPLTTADLASHNTITSRLRAITPNIPILSEESSSVPYSKRASWDCYWLIDPLDGTREFIKRNDEFTVNIALVCKQIATLGVVYVPVTKTFYFGAADCGVFKQLNDQNPQTISTRTSTPNNSPTICGSRSHTGKSLQKLMDKLGEHHLVSMGSSIKMCLVAEGVADIYPRFGPTSEWDTAAAHAILNEAGGEIVDLSMQPLRYNTKDSLLNPSFIALGNNNNDWRKFLLEL